MKIKVNGDIKALDFKNRTASLAEVIEKLGHNSLMIVIEFNGAILPPQDWETQSVQEGDILEIVTIVGGGS